MRRDSDDLTGVERTPLPEQDAGLVTDAGLVVHFFVHCR
jgi:hypothetical protein